MSARKPVRAWARALDMDEYVHEDRVGFKVCAWKRGEGDVQVTVLPDGTPSQAAEVRKLRRLLRIALCAAENYIAAMEPHEGECDEPEDQAVIWHARKHVAEVKAALRGRRGAK